MPDARTCSDCGSELPARAPEGLCPRCLLGAGLNSDTLSVSRSGDVGATMSLGSGGVLETITATLGAVPRVLLRDTDAGPEPPLVRPSAEVGVGGSTRYRIDGEIGRGGMGSVLRGRDPDLGRDIAIKVLRDDLRNDAEMVRRFVEEAQIGGQLQHPGIVPIYELGAFADRRPFFSMKLVKGHTLAGLLDSRRGATADLPSFLNIIESVAQTVAYAHARGVIHRDLKPSNVMVGSFGEVQVMDWGLAKVLPRGGVADDGSAGLHPRAETVIATARSGSGDSDLSHAGSVLGTPSYMAPEQARGEIDRVDERADVFALGSILCEVLTGRPAFTGRSPGEIQRTAALGDTADALARLGACGADPELVDLARDCLAREREDRPRDAGTVSGRLTGYLAGVQERLRRAEIARAAVEARAEEAEARARAERQARRMTAGLAASVLLLVVAGGGAAAWLTQQRQARLAAADRFLGEASTLLDRARARPEEPAGWREALAAVERVEADGLPREARARLDALGRDARAGAAAAVADRVLLDRLVDVRSAESDDPGSATEPAYADAFRAAGLDVDALGPEAAGAAIRSRPGPVALALAAALDDWASQRRLARPNDPDAWHRLLAAAAAADPDPGRRELRATWGRLDLKAQREPLRALAAQADIATWPVQTLILLADALEGAGDADAATTLLRRGAAQHPEDVWVNYMLATLLNRAHPPRRDEAIRFFTVARALRPETAHVLAHALEDRGDADEALAVFRDLVRLRPENGKHLGCLGTALQSRGRSDEARAMLDATVTASRAAIRRKPDYATAHSVLARALQVLGRPGEAEAEYRESIRLDPNDAAAHSVLGNALADLGRPGEAEAAYREAIRLDPGDAVTHYALGNALMALGKAGEAEAAYREAIRLRPDFPYAHDVLGNALKARGKPDEAIAEFREAIRLRPAWAMPYSGLGGALLGVDRPGEAEAAYREAIRLQPGDALAHYYLGNVLKAQGKREDAIAAYRESARLDAEWGHVGSAVGALGSTLKELGRPDETDAIYRQALAKSPREAAALLRLADELKQRGRPEAIDAYHEAIRLNPRDAEAHRDIGIALMDQKKLGEAEAALSESIRLKPGDALAHYYLGNVLKAQGKREDAIAAYRESARLDAEWGHVGSAVGALGSTSRELGRPDETVAIYRTILEKSPRDASAHRDRAAALQALGKSNEAIDEIREATRLRPDDFGLRATLGNALIDLGRLDEAAAEYREAARLRPDDPMAYHNLGLVEQWRGADEAAIAASRRALEMNPNIADAHRNIGLALLSLGRPGEADAAFREAKKVAPDHAELPGELRMVALAPRLPAVLRGEDRPAGAAERIDFANLCYRSRRFVVAARLYAEALAEAPTLADDRKTLHAQQAAVYATLAGCVEGRDVPAPTADERAALRRLALGLLRSELGAWARTMGRDPNEANNVLAVMRGWKNKYALAFVRTPTALAVLPETERKDWQALWADVDALLKRAEVVPK